MKLSAYQPMAAALLAVAAFTGPANAASLLGDSITAGYYFPDSATVYGNYSVSPSDTFTVGAGPEATGTVDGFQQVFDFGGTSFTLTFQAGPSFNSASFNGWQFLNNSNTFDAITSVTGIDPSRVTVSGNTLSVNWQGLGFDPDSQIVVNFGAVPEPASWTMLIAGFGLVGLAMRRRAVVAAA